MESVFQDLRYAVRALRRSPGLALMAVLCMGLGIGAVTSMFSTAEAFTFRPLPQVRDADRVVHVWESPTGSPRGYDGLSPAAYREARALRVFSDLTAARNWDANITGNDIPERVRAERVSFNFLRAVGHAPLLGRDFTLADEDAGRVVILSYGLWQRRFGGDRGIVGRVVRINGEGYTVVGVLPEDFVFPPGAQLLAPLALTPADWAVHRGQGVFAMGRLAPGVTPAQAQAAVAALGARLAADYPATNAGWEMQAEPAEPYFGSGPRPFMMVLLAAGAFVLLIACANVANLLLARATAHRRELAVRVALGASRGRLVRQLLAESLLVSLVGAVLGILGALWSLDALANAVPVEVRAYIPGFGQLQLDWRAMIFAVVAAVGSGVLFGLIPAFSAARLDVQASLKEGARGEVGGAGAGRTRAALVVAEVALALMLLVGASQMLATFRHLALTDPGFQTDGVLTLGVTLPRTDYPRDSDVVQFYRSLEDRVATLPGVQAVGSTTVLPLSWNESAEGVETEDRPLRRREDAPMIGMRQVSPGYLSALGISLVSGRAPTAQDDADAPPVAVVSEAAARLLWPGVSPLGKRFRADSGLWIQVVGVARDVRPNPLIGGGFRAVAYFANRQFPARGLLLVVRAAGDPAGLAGPIQRVIASLDTRLAAGDVMPMRRVVAAAISPQSATAQTLVLAALVALVMASVGIFGVMAHSVTQRTQEIGVRVALGASPRGVLALVLGRALKLAAIGIGIGLVGTLALSRGLQAILVGSSATDPLALGAVALVLVAVALVASWVPALRAAKVDPMEALRAE